MKAIVFLLLTFGLSQPLGFWFLASGTKPYSASWLTLAVCFMSTPMISTVITQKLIFRQDLMRPLGISFRPNRWFLVALLLPAVLAVGATASSLLFPGVSLTGVLSEANFLQLFGSSFTGEQVAHLSRSAAELPVHPFFLVLLGGTIAGLTINGVAGFGEELGWRGLLLRELAPLGFWRASFVIGVVWGLWHLPFILHGHNYPGYPIAGIFLMTVWTVLFSPLIAYVRIRSDSVLSAAIMHGAINGTAIAPALVLKGGNALETGVLGFAGILVLLCLNIALLAAGKPREWHEKWMQ